VLSEKGANWATVGASLTENRTVENMERIFKAAKANGYEATRPDKRAAAGVSTSRSTRSARRAPLWFALGGPPSKARMSGSYQTRCWRELEFEPSVPGKRRQSPHNYRGRRSHDEADNCMPRETATVRWGRSHTARRRRGEGHTIALHLPLRKDRTETRHENLD